VRLCSSFFFSKKMGGKFDLQQVPGLKIVELTSV